MRAVVLHGPKDLRIEDIPVPEPASGELLLRVETVGVCGSDLSEFDHGPVLTPLHQRHPITGHLGPVVLGHEFSGVVEVSRSESFQEGDLVACAAAVSCGACRYCTSGQMGVCEGYWAVGLNRDGALAEYCVVPATTCVHAGELTPDAAALAQPMSIAIHAVRRSRLVLGETAVVIGIGGIGALIANVAASIGATVVACDTDAHRLEVAQRLGAHHTVRVKPGRDLRTRLSEAEIESDVVFEVTGTPDGLVTAYTALAPGTRLVAVGIHSQPAELDLRHLTLSEHEIIGTNGLDTLRDLPAAVRVLAASPALWDGIAPIVTSLEALVEGELRAPHSPRPIKVLASPLLASARSSRMG